MRAQVFLPDESSTKVRQARLPTILEDGDEVLGTAAGIGPVTITVSLVTDHGAIVGYSEHHDQHYTLVPESVSEAHLSHPLPGCTPSPVEERLEDLVDDAVELERMLRDVHGLNHVHGDLDDVVDVLRRANRKLCASDTLDHPRPAEAV